MKYTYLNSVNTFLTQLWALRYDGGVHNANISHLSVTFAGDAGTRSPEQVRYENDQNSNAGVFVFL